MKKFALLLPAICLIAACSTGPGEEISDLEQYPGTDVVTRAASVISLECQMELFSNSEKATIKWEVPKITFIGADNTQTSSIGTGTPGYISYGTSYGSSKIRIYNSSLNWGLDLSSIKIELCIDSDTAYMNGNNFYVILENNGSVLEGGFIYYSDIRENNKHYFEVEVPLPEGVFLQEINNLWFGILVEFD